MGDKNDTLLNFSDKKLQKVTTSNALYMMRSLPPERTEELLLQLKDNYLDVTDDEKALLLRGGNPNIDDMTMEIYLLFLKGMLSFERIVRTRYNILKYNKKIINFDDVLLTTNTLRLNNNPKPVIT